MAQYSFMERFVPMVLDGSKPHTIRNRRRYPAKVGDNAYLFFGLRTKWVKRLRNETVSDTHSISISLKHGIVFYVGLLSQKQLDLAVTNPVRKSLPVLKVLSPEDRDLLAWRDGFRPAGSTEYNPEGSFDLMIRFWTQNKGKSWAGDIIYWQPTVSGLLKAKKAI